MKIAFVYDAVYPWVKGGAEKRIYELGKRLAEMGNEVHIFGIKWWEGPDIFKKERMIFHGVCKPMELYVNGRRSITEAIIFSIRLMPHLVREKFDVIDVSAFPYFSCFTVKLVSVLRRTPVVITWHEVWDDYWYRYLGWKGFFGKTVERLVSKLTAGSIAVSDMTGNNLGSMGVNDVHIVPNGIDLKNIAGISPSADACDIIFIGRLIREKNVAELVESVDFVRRSVPDVKCNIIGSGPEKERLLVLTAERGLQDNIIFKGFMDYDEIIARIKSSKVLVLPSSREGFGMVVVEAFACGVPVITVKCKRNAASLLVDEGTGFVVDLHPEELGKAIRTLITDHSLRKKISSSSVEKAKGYDWDKIVRRLSCLYEEITSRNI